MPTYAPLAQSVEQRTVNPCVVGSSPTGGAKRTEVIRSSFFTPIHGALFVPTLNSRKIILHFQYSSESSNQKNLSPSNANTKLEGYSRFQDTELYPVGIGAEPQQAETRHFR